MFWSLIWIADDLRDAIEGYWSSLRGSSRCATKRGWSCLVNSGWTGFAQSGSWERQSRRACGAREELSGEERREGRDEKRGRGSKQPRQSLGIV